MIFYVVRMIRPTTVAGFLIILLIGALSVKTVSAQNYGLGFFSHNKLKEERTELNLSPEKPFKFENGFNISFDLQFHSRDVDQYGYVLRIIRNDDENIDIVYNYFKEGHWYFYLISGQNTADNPFTISRQTLFKEWITFELNFDPSNKSIILSASDSLISSIPLSFDENDSYRIMFGACDFGTFKTRDVPVMNLKDVKILEQSNPIFHWPLSEISGNESRDVIRGSTAIIRNPDWLKPKHEDWIEIYNTKHDGNSQVAVNYEEEILYLVEESQIIAYSINDNSFRVITTAEAPSFREGCQAIYNPIDNQIYSYNVDEKSYSTFDFEQERWNAYEPKIKDQTVFLHHNKYFSTNDSSLYIFGGYGQHEYKKTVQQANLHSGEWLDITKENDIYEPRYLAASGAIEDTLYILGGYGSPSGDQMLNPNTYSNYVAYAISTNTMVRKQLLDIPIPDICFSNSLILNPKSREYYALAFPIFADEAYLQLIKGSLDSKEMMLMGKKLPYQFHDTKSYSDLFYFPASNKMIAYTSFLDSEQRTTAQLYSIQYPPNILQASNQSEARLSFSFGWLGIGILLILVIPLAFMFRRKYRNSLVKETDFDHDAATEITDDQEVNVSAEPTNSHILFFGGFQVFDLKGSEITGKFTPLIKELFLLIWLNTVKSNKGISSERMTEILWFDKSESSARNNKAVNIAKLRTILSEIGHCRITSKTGYWKIVCDDDGVYNDYVDFLNLTKAGNQITKNGILRLIAIAEKGNFLVNVNYEWLDEFKASVSETIIETLYNFTESLNIKDEASLIIRISECIFNCDSINEEAMVLKCKAHFEMGAHTLSKSTYIKFCKDYSELYGQEYDKPFADITSKPLKSLIYS